MNASLVNSGPLFTAPLDKWTSNDEERKCAVSPEDCEGPRANLAFFAVPLPDHPEVRVLAQAE